MSIDLRDKEAKLTMKAPRSFPVSSRPVHSSLIGRRMTTQPPGCESSSQPRLLISFRKQERSLYLEVPIDLAASVVRFEKSTETHRLTSPSPSPSPPAYSLCNAISPRASAPRRLLSAGPCVFSIGDFLGVVSLLRDLIDALQEGGRTSGEQEALIAELQSLESAILQVEAHYRNTEYPAQRMALDQAARACQKSVNDFLSSVRERQREARADGTGHTGMNKGPDMRWNLAMIKDIVTFRCRVSAHVQSIQTLLITIQVSSSETARSHENIRSGHSTQTGLVKSTNHLVVLINESFDTLRQAPVDQGSASQQRLASFEAVREILIMNSEQLQSALQQLQDSLPPQVLLQQPVIFTDALDRIAPIHLDWISTWDAFLAVLELRFAYLGYNKIKRREFALQETGSHKDLLFTRTIGMRLTPGQQVDMRMVFQDKAGEELSNTCPHCQTRCQGSTGSETTCPHRGCQFRRIQQLDDSSEAIREAMSIQAIIAQATAGTPKKRRRTLQLIPDDEVRPCDFKRLRLMWSPCLRMKRRSGTLGVHSILNPNRQVEPQPDPGLDIHQIPREQAQDPYAVDGGHQNYVALWYEAQQQQQQQQPSEQKVATRWQCRSCNRAMTQKPQWGPDGPGTLCYACYLHYMKLTRKMPVSKSAASTKSNRELNNPDASKLARKRRKFNPNAAIDEDFLSHGRWEPVESVRNDGFGGAAPSPEPNRRNSPWSTLIRKTDAATDPVIKFQVPSPRLDSHGPGIYTPSASTASRPMSKSFAQQLEAPIVANVTAAMFPSASPSAYPTQPVGTLAGTQYMHPTVQDTFLADTSGLGTSRLRHADELAKGYDPDSDWLQLQDISEAADQYRTTLLAQPIQRAPVDDSHKSHKLQREWLDGFSVAPWQYIPPRFDSSMFHGPTD